VHVKFSAVPVPQVCIYDEEVEQFAVLADSSALSFETFSTKIRDGVQRCSDTRPLIPVSQPPRLLFPRLMTSVEVVISYVGSSAFIEAALVREIMRRDFGDSVEVKLAEVGGVRCSACSRVHLHGKTEAVPTRCLTCCGQREKRPWQFSNLISSVPFWEDVPRHIEVLMPKVDVIVHSGDFQTMDKAALLFRQRIPERLTVQEISERGKQQQWDREAHADRQALARLEALAEEKNAELELGEATLARAKADQETQARRTEEDLAEQVRRRELIEGQCSDALLLADATEQTLGQVDLRLDEAREKRAQALRRAEEEGVKLCLKCNAAPDTMCNPCQHRVYCYACARQASRDDGTLDCPTCGRSVTIQRLFFSP